MTDTVTKQKRSTVMAAVKSEGNRSTELELAHYLRQSHLKGWRRKQLLLGRPDFTFRHERVLIFVDGCFWHGCPKCYRRPSSNRKYWDAKVEGNITRDQRVRAKLRRHGWSVIRIWEHELSKPTGAIARIGRKLGERRR